MYSNHQRLTYTVKKMYIIEDISCGRGKDVTLFQKAYLTSLHQENKTTKKTAATTKIGLKTVQRIIKTWRSHL